MCFYSDSETEFGVASSPVARKEHKCGECRGIIAKGEKYGMYSGKCDGHFFVAKSCRRCEYDRNRVVEQELAEGCHWTEAWPPFEHLVRHLRESGLGQTRPEDVPASFKIGDLPEMPKRELATNTK